jgi:hypothetical protein
VEDLLAGFGAYYLTTLPVLVGVLFGMEFLRTPRGDTSVLGADPITACIHFDAREYLQIIRHGYSYDPDRGSTVAFFPAYPLLSRLAVHTLRLLPADAALLVTHAALLGVFVLLARYVRVRWPEATAEQRGLVLALFGLWPLGLFLRMPYSESLFVCSTLAVLYGITRGWPLSVLALLTGFVTAVRPVGVALTAAFLWYVLALPELRTRTKAIRLLLLLPLACWGLLAYMVYQWLAFDAPFGFAQTQQYWPFMAPEDRSWLAKLRSLAMLEPLWGVYVPGYSRYWGNISAGGDPLFSLTFWNPILFVLARLLLLLGAWEEVVALGAA